MSVLARIEHQARTIGYRPAVRTDHGIWNFGKLWDRTQRIASGLQNRGVRRGQSVGLVGDNSEEYLAAFLGTLLAGAVVVPINTRLLGSEVLAQLALAEAVGAIVMDKDSPLANDLASALQCWSSLDLDDSPSLPWAQPDPRDPALCTMTTGTTGVPKGVIHSHGSLEQGAAEVASFLPIAADEISMAFLPFYASIPEHALPMLFAGGSIRVLRKYSVDAVIAMCSEVTSFHAVPTIVGRLLADGDHAQLSKLRWISFASEPMPLSLLQRWWSELPCVETYQFYGMSEVLPITYASSSVMKESPGCVGVPFNTSNVKILNDQMEPVPPGTEGEVVCASPAQMLHYLGRPDLTELALTPDGSMRTGDLGTFDATGRLHLTGRIKDVIISGGLNVAPAEIELVASRFPGVDSVAAIGVPSAEWGETPVLVVVALPDESVDLAELLSYCKSELAGFKRPSAAAHVRELPMSGIGKTDKTLLRLWLAEGELELVRTEAGRGVMQGRP